MKSLVLSSYKEIKKANITEQLKHQINIKTNSNYKKITFNPHLRGLLSQRKLVQWYIIFDITLGKNFCLLPQWYTKGHKVCLYSNAAQGIYIYIYIYEIVAFC